MPQSWGGGGGGGGAVQVGMRRAKFRENVHYWERVYSHCGEKYKTRDNRLSVLTIALSLSVSVLSLLSVTLGASGSEPVDPCEGVASQCYVQRAADVLGGCTATVTCDADTLQAAVFADEAEPELEAQPFVEQIGGMSGLLSLIAGGVALLITTLATCGGTLKWGAKAAAYTTASQSLGLLTAKVDALSRTHASTRLTDEEWEELDASYKEIREQLLHIPTDAERKEAVPEGKPADAVLPANLVSFADELEEIGIMKDTSERWLDGDIEIVLKDRDIELPPPLLRDLREKSRREHPSHVGKKMRMVDVLEKIKDNLNLPDEGILAYRDDDNNPTPSRRGTSQSRGTPTTPGSPGSFVDDVPPTNAEEVVDKALEKLGLDDSSVLEKHRGREIPTPLSVKLGLLCNELSLETGWEPLWECHCQYTQPSCCVGLYRKAVCRKDRPPMIVPQWQCKSLCDKCTSKAVRMDSA